MTSKANQVIDEVKSLQFKLLKIQYLQHLIGSLKEVPADTPTDFGEVHQEIYGMCVDFFEDKILDLAGKVNVNTTPKPKNGTTEKSKTGEKDEDARSFSERNKKFGGKIIRGLDTNGVLLEGVAIMLKEPHIVIETKQGNKLIHESFVLDKERY